MTILKSIGPNKCVGRKIFSKFNKRIVPNKSILDGKICLKLINVQYVYYEHQSNMTKVS